MTESLRIEKVTDAECERIDTFEEHYHLCPICGLPSPTTSRICPEHTNIVYVYPCKFIEMTEKELAE